MKKAERLTLTLSNARLLKTQGRYAEAFTAYEEVIEGLQEKPINNRRPKQNKKKPTQ